MTDTTIRVKQATTEQRVLSLESRVRSLTEKLDKLSHDAISKKAISWILGTLAALLMVGQAVWHMIGGE